MAPRQQSTIEFVVQGPIARADLPGIAERLAAVLEEETATVLVVCEVRDVEASAVAVDVLARLQLLARRRGCRMAVCGASDSLLEFLAFLGMRGVLQV